jgi:hypothetical protein
MSCNTYNSFPKRTDGDVDVRQWPQSCLRDSFVTCLLVLCGLDRKSNLILQTLLFRFVTRTCEWGSSVSIAGTTWLSEGEFVSLHSN